MSLYIAHKREDGKTQSLAEHLRGVAEMAASFAAPFGAAEQAYRAGLLHDLGKYGKTSQYRMQHPDTTSPCDHSTAGAQKAFRHGERVVAVYGLPVVIAFRQAHHPAAPQIDGRKNQHATTSPNARRIFRPTGPLFSGWNCAPYTFPACTSPGTSTPYPDTALTASPANLA